MNVTVIGAGLAGCEAAWQLAERGIHVTLCEMKPEKMSPAHHSIGFAELVCSNSLRSDQLENAVGLLKEELRRCGSLILRCADQTRVEAGGALAVDRDGVFQSGYRCYPLPPQHYRKRGRSDCNPGGRGHCGQRSADL